MNNSLLKKIQEWDGKHNQLLKEIYTQNIQKTAFFKDLVEIYKKEKTARIASTWLIKHHYDQKNKLQENLIAELFSQCNLAKHWETKLHLLQILPQIKIPKECLNEVDLFVRNCFNSENKFVKAWAYEGLYQVSKSIPEYKNELKLLCDTGMENASASIKVKIRRVLKKIEN